MFGATKVEGKLCHETQFKKPCCRDQCPKWVRLLGHNPQTGATVDEYNCADTWVPLLIVEVSQKLVQLDATMHNLNNELNKRNAALNGSAQRLVDIFQSAQQQQRMTGGN